jgi:4-carboxymuconolactone decarboxylase
VCSSDLIEVFDNFAFDEVLQYGNLDTRTRLMVILASMIASQAVAEYKMMLGGALNVGVTPVEVQSSSPLLCTKKETSVLITACTCTCP